MNVPPVFTNISKWQVNTYLQSGGTREKCWVVNPANDKLYFFKESHHNYTTEFWMEIIASKIGQHLGLEMLDYHIAVQDDKIGCLSINMVEDGEELSELIKFLTGYDTEYNPDRKNKENQEKYTLSFVEETLKYYRLKSYIENFIKVIIFDSIIGNQDRHQENWGFILTRYVETESASIKSYFKRALVIFALFFQKIIKQEVPNAWYKSKFAPIYDSGSCLGRENTEDKIRQLLKNEVQLEAYIKRCKSELRLNAKKEDYFTLIKKTSA